MKNLALAVIAVMKEVKGMEKNSRVGTGQNSYDGTKYNDVAEVFNNALEKAELCIMPIDIEESTEISQWQEVDQWSKEVPKPMKQKQSVFTKVKTKYLLLHSSGESQVIAGYGHGVDPQDKGAGKATTYAMKNALLYAFLTPVGKMQDTDTTHTDDIPVPKKGPSDLQIAMASADGCKDQDLKSLEDEWAINTKFHNNKEYKAHINKIKAIIVQKKINKIKEPGQ